MALLSSHSGSWFGLPDFGLTEKLTGNRTAQGGSNIIASAPKSSAAPMTQSVNGASTNIFGGLASGATAGSTPTSSTSYNYSAPSGGGDPFQGAVDSANAGQDALLSSLNTEFDRNASNLNNQLGYLASQKDNSLNELNTSYTGVENQVKNQKVASETNRDNAIAQAGSVAQSTQLQNRNILRALGILNSTAGGDLLSKPINEFDKQRAQLVAGHIQRINELDDTLNQAASEHANAVKSLENNYAQLVGQIQTDLRFNDRQRADAIKSANAALQQRLSDIQTSLFNYKTQVDAAKASAGQQISAISNYTLPTADTNAISATLANPGATATNTNATIYGTDQKKKPGDALLSGIGIGALNL